MRGGRILFTTRTLVVVCDLGFAPAPSLGFDKTMDFGLAFRTFFVLLSTTARGFAFAPAFDFDLFFVFATIYFLVSYLSGLRERVL